MPQSMVSAEARNIVHFFFFFFFLSLYAFPPKGALDYEARVLHSHSGTQVLCISDAHVVDQSPIKLSESSSSKTGSANWKHRTLSVSLKLRPVPSTLA